MSQDVLYFDITRESTRLATARIQHHVIQGSEPKAPKAATRVRHLDKFLQPHQRALLQRFYLRDISDLNLLHTRP